RHDSTVAVTDAAEASGEETAADAAVRVPAAAVRTAPDAAAAFPAAGRAATGMGCATSMRTPGSAAGRAVGSTPVAAAAEGSATSAGAGTAGVGAGAGAGAEDRA